MYSLKSSVVKQWSLTEADVVQILDLDSEELLKDFGVQVLGLDVTSSEGFAMDVLHGIDDG